MQDASSQSPGLGASPPASDADLNGIVGSLFEDERLARAAAMGVPAFVRRALAVEAAEAGLLARVSRDRSKRLRWPMRIGRVLEQNRLCGDDLPHGVLHVLEVLRGESTFFERSPPASRNPGRAARDFAKAVARFNERWREYLEGVSLADVHGAQEKYNRYYALERESALRGLPPRGFVPLALFPREELRKRFPPLPEVRIP